MVSKNLEVIIDAVVSNKELLVSEHNQDEIMSVPTIKWEGIDQRRKDRTKFVISKTIAFCPTLFDEDAGMRDKIAKIYTKLIKYLNDRQMTPLAELMEETIAKEKSKDSALFDYYYKEGQ